jgi:uncharacterized membrane protein
VALDHPANRASRGTVARNGLGTIGRVVAVTTRNGASRRRMLLLEALLVVTGLVTAGVGLRVVGTQSLDLTNLVWNLVLAWIPFVLALALYDGARRGAATLPLLGIGALWLLFLPNAPYIVTDAKWLGRLESGTRWYDPLLVGGAATVGLVLGFVSLFLVQAVVARRLGRLVGWAAAWAALVASGLGVYLGRYLRWNSWDLIVEPGRILGELGAAALDPLAHQRPLALSTVFAILWCAGYLLFYSAFRSQLARLDDR